jgi:hypothetical protein
LGLFATRAIKANTIISFYPAHALGVDGHPFVYSNSSEESYFASHPHPASPYLHCTDQLIFERSSLLTSMNGRNSGADNASGGGGATIVGSQNEPIYLDVNPERPTVEGWVSQIINDGAALAPEQHTALGILDYYRQSKLVKNCIHIPLGPSPILATVTTKKVKKGQELLTLYGGTYWLGNDAGDDGTARVALTPEVQKEVQESAADFRAAMKTTKVMYAGLIQALRDSFTSIG